MIIFLFSSRSSKSSHTDAINSNIEGGWLWNQIWVQTPFQTPLLFYFIFYIYGGYSADDHFKLQISGIVLVLKNIFSDMPEDNEVVFQL